MLLIEKIIISSILGIVGIIFIALGIYFKITSNKFKKEGIKTIFKVKKIKEENQIDAKGNIIGKLYTTTFEFKYNNEVKIETLETHKKFNLKDEVPGIYLPTGKLNKISLAGEGFQISTKANLILIAIGLLFILITTIIIL